MESLTMSWNVLVTREIPSVGIALLKNACQKVEVHQNARALSKKELMEKIRTQDGLLCVITDEIDAQVLEAGRRLKVVSNFGAGFNNIDVQKATELGILVTNTPDVLTDATADLAWALLLATARRVVEGDRFVREGRFKGWHPLLLLGTDFSGKTLGIVGAGRIGTAMALRSKGFGMKIVYVHPRRNEILETELSARWVNLETLLRISDFVSLHVPLTPKTQHLIGAKELAMMKPTAYLINTSRGPVVDEKALVQALQTGQIAGAGLDVYENEPEVEPALLEMKNVVLTPHLGSATEETRNRMAVLSAENLLAGLRGEIPQYVVNREVLSHRRKE